MVCYSTPKHASWMNQVEIWLSILVRKLLKRGNFTSLGDVRNQILAFTDYYNHTILKALAGSSAVEPTSCHASRRSGRMRPIVARRWRTGVGSRMRGGNSRS